MAAEPSRANAPLAVPSCSRFWVEKRRPARLRPPIARLRPLRPPLRLRPDFVAMLQQLAYVIITPYTLSKSRTGGILARLITRTGLEMIGARMFAPSPELVAEYSNVI